ncbi:MrpF/PhaF family protein [Kitasatospora sp. DSM 101779]|uniref:MrpF/PhaF family protein n=1 Tax=Kitasatospora sp. DSM 101779 TaxID=2853165 RepID=UPI0021D9254B|nr:MrpF/PhaF family protein [Kitasatospora sp. DSM 101779]MCU7826733.1 MrpF/PhaF family protein [Kitasatospora sp. DSM 101779]
MSAWTAAAVVLLAADVPACLWAVSRGSAVARLIGLSLLSSVLGAVFLLLPQAYDRSSYQDLALVLGVLAPAGALVFTRFVVGRGDEPEHDPEHDPETTTTDGGTP